MRLVNHQVGHPEFSICIPAHIESQTDLNYLHQAIESVRKQKLVKFEILISDDSNNLDLVHLLQEYESLEIDLKLVNPPIALGLGSNLNNCVSQARGRYVKILFQDDLLSHKYALLNMGLRLQVSRRKWLAAATIHFQQDTGSYVNKFKPKKSHALLLGKNSISSPSVILFKKEFYLPFHEELKYLIDCEWYLRMSHFFGLPVFFKQVSVINRIHKNQATHKFSELLTTESQIATNLHDVSMMGLSLCKCREIGLGKS
jgi:glycosyltransferase involved in cell wall biosynthesis